MRPLSFNDRYWFVKLTIGILALAAVVVVVLLSIKSCTEEPHTHTESENWIISKAASCTTEGVRYKVCTGCGEQLKYEPIPAKGHNPGAAKTENKKNSTCTAEGSFESAVYCTVCNVELSREEKIIEMKDHKPSAAVIENSVAPTCTKYGSYDEVVYCSTCPSDNRYEIDRTPITVSPTGHSYEWKLFYDTDGEVKLRGTCAVDCGEEHAQYVFTEEDSGLVVTHDESCAHCCRWYYSATITHNGEEVFVELDMSKEGSLPLHTLYYDDEQQKYITADSLLEAGESYYDYSNPTVAEYIYLPIGSTWDDNGFALGVYTCATCEDSNCAQCNGEYWIYVTLYNAEYDTRLQ